MLETPIRGGGCRGGSCIHWHWYRLAADTHGLAGGCASAALWVEKMSWISADKSRGEKYCEKGVMDVSPSWAFCAEYPLLTSNIPRFCFKCPYVSLPTSDISWFASQHEGYLSHFESFNLG